MVNGKKIVVVMPAYNAAKTLEQTYSDIPMDVVDEVILVDDASQDDTIQIAKRIGIKYVIRHEANKGYGANQKSCYAKALAIDADVIIMLHPDYQYNPKLIPAMASLVANGVYPAVIGSRILGKNAVKNGMPLYKYIFNRGLTLFQNLLLGQKLSEYHSGYRAFSKQVLQEIHYEANADGFIFDNQMLLQILYKGYTIGEISCPAKYFPEASSINFSGSVVYGAGIVVNTFRYLFSKLKVISPVIYKKKTPGKEIA